MVSKYDKPWHVIDLDISNAFVDSFSREKLLEDVRAADDTPMYIWAFKGQELNNLFKTEWLNYMYDKVGYPLFSAFLFYRAANYNCPTVHCDIMTRDGKQYPSNCALNWVLDDPDNSAMTWYDLPLDSGNVPMAGDHPPVVQEKYTVYKGWKQSDVTDKLIAKRALGKNLTLVRTGIPHNIEVGNSPRWSITVRFNRDYERDIQTWEQTVDHFSRWIKDTE